MKKIIFSFVFCSFFSSSFACVPCAIDFIDQQLLQLYEIQFYLEIPDQKIEGKMEAYYEVREFLQDYLYPWEKWDS